MWQDVDKKKKKKYINKFATITLFNNYYIKKNTTENTLLNVTGYSEIGRRCNINYPNSKHNNNSALP